MRAKTKGPLRFKVRGHYPFPIDMLRYDGCIPDSERDSYLIVSVSDIVGRAKGPVEITLKSFYEPAHRPTVGRWRSFGWDVSEVYDERQAAWLKVFVADKPMRDQDAVNQAVLRQCKEHGLTFSDCIRAFGVPDHDPLVVEARSRYHREGHIEIGDPVVVSISEPGGEQPVNRKNAYVLAWVYVDDVLVPIGYGETP